MTDELDFVKYHPSVAQYLAYVEKTESPRIFHIWAFLSGISAAMGRRCYLPMGTGEVFPNMYIILTGPPAVRKSTAFKIVCSLLRRNTTVKFAPDDTSGQRQGLIAAMMNCSGGERDDDKALMDSITKTLSKNDKKEDNVTLGDLSGALAQLGAINLDTRDPRTMLIAASELNSILGEGNTALLTFLQKMWDGDAYKYQLKNTQVELKDALLGIIAATTPSQLAIAMPSEAVGQGFTSRAIFVYADKKYARRIARPELRADLEGELGERFAQVSEQFNGPFIEETVASNTLDKLYERGIHVQDPRFVHYADRRHTHLQKLCMSLAASRGEQCIRLIDVEFADQLLLYTEQFMPEALGEYGMSKLSAAKQRLLEFLKTSDGPIPMQALHGLMARDMTIAEFKNTISELHNGKKLTIHNVPALGQCVTAISENQTRSAKGDLKSIESFMVKKA